MALTFVFIPFLMDFWNGRKMKSKIVLEKVPFLLVLAGLLFVYGLIQLKIGKVITEDAGVSNPEEIIHKISSLKYINTLPFFLQWIFTTPVRFILWLLHIILPVKLSITYPHDTIFKSLGYSIFISPFIILALFIYAWKKKSNHPELLGGLLFFGLTLAPALLITISGRALFLADRYTYIPSIGILFILVVLLNKIKFNSFKYYFLFSAVFLFYFIITARNVNHWKNTETLFVQALKVYPKSGLAHEALGNYYREQNNLPKALNNYNQAIKSSPNASLYNSRGIIYGKDGEWDKALQDFNKALDLKPGFADALLNRGNVYFNLKRYDDIKKDLKDYLQIKPEDASVIFRLGLTYSLLKKYDEAITQYNKALKLDPNMPIAYAMRSSAYNAKGDKIKALEDALKAKQLGYNVNANYLNALKQQLGKK